MSEARTFASEYQDFMERGATKAIAAVRELGVDIIERPYAAFLKAAGGLHCSTIEIWRERGPLLGEQVTGSTRPSAGCRSVFTQRARERGVS